MNYKVEYLEYKDVPKEEQWGMDEYDTALKITYRDGSYNYYFDAMEPEDVKFCRDLNWIKEELNRAYEEGYMDGYSGAE